MDPNRSLLISPPFSTQLIQVEGDPYALSKDLRQCNMHGRVIEPLPEFDESEKKIWRKTIFV